MKSEAVVASAREAERVILVHGTFASSPDDCGDAWWQVGSRPYEALKRRLPQSTVLAADGQVFRWSGHNTERARSKAAAKLLRYLEPLEEAGQHYHLVGHSHGGSVIWSALRLATTRKQSLDCLRSWTTVGTPFLQHQSKSPWSPINIAYMILATMLLWPAWRCFSALIALPYDVAMGNLDNGIILAPDEEVGLFTAVTRIPILKGLELLGVPLTETPEGTRLGSFDPQTGDSVSYFLFGTLEGWLILGAILLFGYIMLLLGSFFLSSVLEGMRIGWEKRLEQQAFDRYRQRWLGLWTQDDEAINGLRATMELSVSFIGDFVVRERIFLSDLISVAWRPIYSVLAPLYNRTVRPVLDGKIREIVIKTAQGNDRPAAQVVAVSPHPVVASPGASVPPLPEQLRVRIRAEADRHAHELGPKLRELIAQPSMTAGLEGFSQTLSGKELVHTSYFDHPEVIELLALNIGWSREGVRPRPAHIPAAIEHWFSEFKQLQGAVPKHRMLLPTYSEPNLSSSAKAA